MNPIWKIYYFARKKIPVSLIRKLRSFIESNSNFLWKKEYYSQFGEDAVLRSIFEHLQWNSGMKTHGKGLQKGFYVDVGAYAPKQFSNTYSFYRMGWSGINIDATPNSMAIFKRVRKRDINLEAAISDKEIDLTFYSWGVPSVANTLSEEHAKQFTELYNMAPTETRIKTQRLEQVLDKYLPAEQEISFMSIDVEDHNLEVLKSNNWQKYRPTFVLVELDQQDQAVDDITKSEIYAFMQQQNYRLRSWLYLNLLFEAN